jgi:multidrug efflux pump subunit AcrB
VSTPQLYLDIDRTKVQLLGVNVPDVFAALQIYVGSAYVNDFNLFGRTFRVTAQADSSHRLDAKDVLSIRVRNNTGGTVPLASFTTVSDIAGPYRVPRYNLYPSAELDGAAAPGYSPGQAIAIMEQLAKQTLPDGFAYEWTTLAFQQNRRHRDVRLRARGGVRVPGAGGAVREPRAAARDDPDRAGGLVASVVGVVLRRAGRPSSAQVGFVVLIGLAARTRS